MPKFLDISNEKNNLKKIQLINMIEWNDVRDEIATLYKNGIIRKEPIEVTGIHYNLLGSILFSAMDKGLKKTKTKWFFPYFRADSSKLIVETTSENLVQHYSSGALLLGFKSSYQDGFHFFFDIIIPNFLFNMLYETKSDLWDHLATLFNITTSRFHESVPHEDVEKSLLDNGKYGFYKFIKYLIATEIKPFSTQIDREDTLGSVELTFFAWTDMDELVEKISKAVELANKIYSYLLNRYYKKEKRLERSSAENDI
jgi:hypothetical protein